MNLHQHIREQLTRLLAEPGADEALLNNALRLLAKYRSTLIQNTLVQSHGTKVMSGPFAGMDFIERSAEGCHVPKLLGCYEEELHDFISELPGAGYDTIINIGCAEGYYAVGFKWMLPDARVLAFDIDPKAREACRLLADKNHVQIEIGEEFKVADFACFSGKTLIWCDIEGAEAALLDPALAPALSGMDIVVEFHPLQNSHTIRIIPPRFAATHQIEILYSKGHNPVLPPFLQQLGHLDQLLAQWEWRSAPTPWAIMRAK